MSDDEKHHPRLMMLHESGGHIEGRAKYHKLLFNYADEQTEDSSLDFVLEERGPYDPGLSKAMRRYLDLGLVEVEEDEEPHKISETEKCKRYMSGYERTKMRLDDAFNTTKTRIKDTVSRHGDKSANEMVQRDNIQDAKDNPLQKNLDKEK
ncbi:hypothetical protein [Halogranum rubrum]|uniref:hypothetical protein n=1 Tax=Halogranum rubrum TaxID=553466 RepID=UPI000677D0C1|nr:hypothetical protein [Halogranum salarium]